MDVIGAKVLAGFIFFFVVAFFGWTPYWCCRRYFGEKRPGTEQRSARQSLLVQLLHSLASGVLLATCLVSLLPESLDAVRRVNCSNKIPQEVTSNQDSTNVTGLKTTTPDREAAFADRDYFPVAECVIALGFLFIYVTDSTIRSCSAEKHSLHLNDDENDEDFSLDLEVGTEPSQRCQSQVLNDSTPQREHGQKPRQLKRIIRCFKSSPEFLTSVFSRKYKLLQQDESRIIESSELSENKAENREDPVVPAASTTSAETHPLTTSEKPDMPAKSGRLRVVALVAALSIHGFFDGIMMGLQTSLSVIFSLLLALTIHKTFVAVGVSLTLLRTNDKRVSGSSIILSVFCFASASPLGILLSAAYIQHTSDTATDSGVSHVSGYLQAFAVGTFMYITFVESTEHRQQDSLSATILSHVFLLVGFALMTVLRATVKT